MTRKYLVNVLKILGLDLEERNAEYTPVATRGLCYNFLTRE